MPSHRHKPLADEVRFVAECSGIVNSLRSKDIGQKALVSGVNVEVTNSKRLTRRNGFTQVDTGVFSAVYGNDPQNKLYAIKDGVLIDIDLAGNQTQLRTGLLDGIYSWGEDPNGNVYFTSDSGSNGIVTQDGVPLLLSLPVPTIASVAVVDTDTWEVRPFNLGKKYTANQMQLMATYTMADGRETAPSETVSLDVAPEVRLIRVSVPLGGVATNIYATAPGGSTYYLVAVTTQDVVTIVVKNMNMTANGVDYPYTSALDSFPADASLLCFCNGRLLAAVYDQQHGLGTIYKSLPLQYHLFNKSADFYDVSAVPLLLLEHEKGAIVGTSDVIYNYDSATGGLEEVARFGVPAGICGHAYHTDKEKGQVYFWTHRGIAKAMPFELVTEGVFSGDPGVQNHAHLLYERGYVKLVASTVSGAPVFNKWSERS